MVALSGKSISILLRAIQRVCYGCFYISSFCSFGLVLLIFYQVVTRHLFSRSSVALQELQWHLFGVIILLSLATALFRNNHVRVDIFYSRFSEGKKKFIDALSYIAAMLVGAILAYYGWRFAITALVFESPKPLDHFSALWFEGRGYLYELLSTIEALFRKTVLVGEISADPGGLEARWMVKALIPLSGMLLFFQSLGLLLNLIWNPEQEQT